MVQNPLAGGDGLQVEIGSQFDSSGIDRAVSRLGDMKMAVAGAGLALGALAAGGIAKSVEAAASFEEAMVGVEKVTDPETAEAMEGAIQDMAATMPIAQEELAGITEQAGRLGVKGVENLTSYTETVAQMATATDLTSQEAADSFARIGTLMDIPVEQSSNLGSAMNELSNSMGTSASEITDVMTRAGGSLNALGVGKEQALALAGAMNEVSPSSRLAAGGVKRMAEAMMDPSNVAAFAEALGVTEEEFVNMRKEDPSGTLLQVAEATNQSEEAANTLKAELGKAGQEFQTLGQNTDSARKATETATKAWEENTSMQEEAETASSTFNAKLQIAKNRLRNIGIEIGQQLLPPLTTLLGHILDGVEWFGQLNDKTDGLAGTFALVAGLLGGLAATAAVAVSLFGGFAAVLGPLIATVSSVAGVVSVLLGPLTGVVGVVGSLLAPLTSAIGVVGGFGGSLLAVLGPIGLVLAAIGILAYAFTNHGDVIMGAMGKAMDFLESALTDAATWLMENGPGLIKKAFKMVGKGLRMVAIDLYNSVTGNGDSILKSVLIDAGTWIVNNGPRILKQAAELAFDAIVAAATGLYEGLIGGSLIPQMFRDIASYIKTAAKSLLTGAINAVIGGIKRSFRNWLNWLTGGRGFIAGVMSDVKSEITDWTWNMRQAGKGLIQGLINGIKDKIRKVKRIASNLAGEIRDRLPGSDAEEGPLSDLTAAGEALPETFAEGMRKRLAAVQGASGSLASEALPAADRRAGRERVVVQRDDGVVQLLDQIRSEMAGPRNDVVLEVDGKELARASDTSRDRFIVSREINQ